MIAWHDGGHGLEFSDGLTVSESGTATGVDKIPIHETVIAASSSDSSLSEGGNTTRGWVQLLPPKSTKQTSLW